MSLDPYFVDFEESVPRHLAEDEQGWDTYLYGAGEEEDGTVDEQGWLSPEALAELERAWQQDEFDPMSVPF